VKRSLAIACWLAMLSASPAHAQFAVSAGIEYFEWTEDVSPIKVKESGALFALGLDWTQQKDRGFLGAYRGRAYFGDVNYDGALLFSPTTPVTGSTSYLGMSNEAQLRYRFDRTRGYHVDVVGALGYDFWERKLSESQKEDYQVVFARLGFETNPSGSRGWLFGAGVKYPLWIEEDANLSDQGYDQNPKLKPARGASAYGQIGYRFQRHLAVTAYLDGYNFGESDPIYVTKSGQQFAFLQPASVMYNVGIRLQYLF
jgi:hypothetical protein